MRVAALLSLFLVLAAPSPATSGAADPGVWRGLVSTLPTPAVNRCVPDVNSALSSLESRGTARSFRYESVPALNGVFSHFQGITRLPHEDGTWIAVSRSGSPRAVALVGPAGVASEITAPEGLTHAGGIQALGYVLAVPFEHKAGRSVVILYDVSDPSHPRTIYELDRSDVPAPSEPGHASAVALARLHDGRVALIVGVRSSKVLDLYLSNQADLTEAGPPLRSGRDAEERRRRAVSESQPRDPVRRDTVPRGRVQHRVSAASHGKRHRCAGTGFSRRPRARCGSRSRASGRSSASIATSARRRGSS